MLKIFELPTIICVVLFFASLYKENTNINMNYNCSKPPAFKRQRLEYQSNQKLLHHYQHLNNQLNSYIHS